MRHQGLPSTSVWRTQGSDHITDILGISFVCFILLYFGYVRNRDEDEGIPSENEEEKKLLDMKARELKGKMLEMVWDLYHLQLQMASLFMSLELSQSAQLQKQIVSKRERQ